MEGGSVEWALKTAGARRGAENKEKSAGISTMTPHSALHKRHTKKNFTANHAPTHTFPLANGRETRYNKVKVMFSL